ncbi:MAG: ArnT family glycosyltransferase [Wujia sp.]
MLVTMVAAIVVGGKEIKNSTENITPELRYDIICNIAIILGVIMRIGYMLYTACDERLYDLGGFNTEDCGHAGYILTLSEYHRLPDSNEIQYYQQPMFYIMGTIVSRLVNFIMGETEAYQIVDATKLVSCFASCIMLYLTLEFSKLMKLKGKAKLVAVMLMSFMPDFYLCGGRVNCDMLAALFMTLEVLYTFKWYKNQTWKNTVYLAICYGLGVSTKISCGIIAIFTAGVFLKVLVDRIKESDKNKFIGLIEKYLVFGVISLPLGLWYCIRNYIRFGQSFTYVLELDKELDLYVGGHSIVQRMFSIDVGNIIETPFANAHGDYNAPVFFVKSSLFGEFVHDREPVAWLLLFSAIMVSVLIVAMIKQLVHNHKDVNGNVMVGLIVLVVASMYWFYYKYPFGCSMDYRYMIFITMPAAMLLGKLAETDKTNITYVSVCAYSVLSILMYI